MQVYLPILVHLQPDACSKRSTHTSRKLPPTKAFSRKPLQVYVPVQVYMHVKPWAKHTTHTRTLSAGKSNTFADHMRKHMEVEAMDTDFRCWAPLSLLHMY
jgi:hypothetical protein